MHQGCANYFTHIFSFSPQNGNGGLEKSFPLLVCLSDDKALAPKGNS